MKVDVRIIAATHQNLELRVQEGKFREDLFHRLNVIRVHLPPLRERREDIPRLARHFLQIAARELGVEAKQLHPETEMALTRLAWYGQRTSVGKHLSLADGNDRRSGGSDAGSSQRAV